MRTLLDRFRDDAAACTCTPAFEDDRLVVAADDCPGGGDLAESADCRATVVDALRRRDVAAVHTRADGLERRYEDRAAALLVAAGRFAERAAFHDDRLATRATRDPLGAAIEAVGRAGPLADLAAETGLAAVADQPRDYDDALRAYAGPAIARSRVATAPPPDGRLDATRTLDSDATVRIYDRPGRSLRTYHLEPVDHTLSADATATLAAAHDLLANGGVAGGRRAPGRAVRRVADADDPVSTLSTVLAKHTRGYGVLEDLFADPGVSDVFASAPAAENDLRVRVDGEAMRTNVRLTENGAAALASRLRRASGRAFSRAHPTIDAVADGVGATGCVRVAGVTEPVSDGTGFAFRAHGTDAWTLPALVANGTLPADAAALLSLAVERAAAGLVAGTRGAGKTTLLSALLWELPAATRVVVLEDTPELPIGDLQQHGRDVQALRTNTGDADRGLSPAEALRTALRLGEGALVLGEVRGEEARVLYEAMRVGASGSAVLGTIHGDGATAVRERVVDDLDVPAASFGATDVVVTLEPYETADGRRRRVARIEEVVGSGADVAFEPLFDHEADELARTGRIDRGNSTLLATLAGADERYSDLRSALADRTAFVETLVEGRRTAPDEVVAAYASRRAEP
ncbi:ATPase, T2SS/T4P/T4SS family [Halobacteriaceae archaeon GCM10025711]